MERLDFTDFRSDLDSVIKSSLYHGQIEPLDEFVDYIKQMIQNVMEANLPEIRSSQSTGTEFKLSSIDKQSHLAEAEFNFNLLGDLYKNYCNGFIDLLFKRGEFYSILDWKSDSLTDDFDSFGSDTVLEEHTNNSYAIQRVLYAYCLIKWLQNIYPNESCEEIFNHHFGGVYYVYLRGCIKNTSNGIYAQTWPDFKTLKQAFDNIIAKRIGGN